MTTPGGAGTLWMSHNFLVRGAPASLIESERPQSTLLRLFVLDRNICGFLWYGGFAGEGLRSVGADGELPIQERVLYPAHRPPFTGRGL